MPTPKLGPKRRINLAVTKVNKEISDLASLGRYALALSGEGYAGGYRDALYDVQLLLNGCIPDRRGYWLLDDPRTPNPKTKT